MSRFTSLIIFYVLNVASFFFSSSNILLQEARLNFDDAVEYLCFYIFRNAYLKENFHSINIIYIFFFVIKEIKFSAFLLITLHER